MSFFEGREMYVKWHGTTSSVRSLKGGGPQGSTIGILEYLSLSNDNSDNVPEKDRFKFVDDLTILEPINLKNAGIASHNFRHHKGCLKNNVMDFEMSRPTSKREGARENLGQNC